MANILESSLTTCYNAITTLSFSTKLVVSVAFTFAFYYKAIVVKVK